MIVPAPPRGRSTSTPQRVLVVDDNRDAAEALAALIDTLGHQVQVLDNGSQALGVSVEWQPYIKLAGYRPARHGRLRSRRRLRTMPERA